MSSESSTMKDECVLTEFCVRSCRYTAARPSSVGIKLDDETLVPVEDEEAPHLYSSESATLRHCSGEVEARSRAGLVTAVVPFPLIGGITMGFPLAFSLAIHS
jgi:hypothetical protein